MEMEAARQPVNSNSACRWPEKMGLVGETLFLFRAFILFNCAKTNKNRPFENKQPGPCAGSTMALQLHATNNGDPTRDGGVAAGGCSKMQQLILPSSLNTKLHTTLNTLSLPTNPTAHYKHEQQHTLHSALPPTPQLLPPNCPPRPGLPLSCHYHAARSLLVYPHGSVCCSVYE